MKKIAIASGILLAATAMTAQAHPEHEGYVTQTTDTSGAPVSVSAGATASGKKKTQCTQLEGL